MIQFAEQNPIDQWLAVDGPLARVMPGYEPRTEQVQMGRAVRRALTQARPLLVEAGTGVGKSLAYLLALTEQVLAGEGRALVSTYTINLQEQLIGKDLPMVQRALDVELRWALAKGRGHYLCHRRLEFAMRRPRLFADHAFGQLVQCHQWAQQTSDGSLSDLPFVPDPAVWDAVHSEHGGCRGRRCRFYDRCFYWRARLHWEQADVVVANHALLFSDCVLREGGYALLPEYRMLVLDEAHTLERVAEEHFGLDVSSGRLIGLLDRLYHPRRRRGLLAELGANDCIEPVLQVRHAGKTFFEAARQWWQDHERQTQGRCGPAVVEDGLSEPLRQLVRALRRCLRGHEDEDEQIELRRMVDRCQDLADDLGAFLGQRRDEHVYWIQCEGRSVRLKSAPLEVGPDLRRCLFDPIGRVVLTSATLSVTAGSDAGGFAFFAGRLGLEDYESLALGSPYDYASQVTLYLETRVPEPNAADFVERAAEVLKEYLSRYEGRTLVLFTSYRMLEQMAATLTPWLQRERMTLLQQGTGTDRSELLRTFRQPGRYVLFGTDSFWQGVDVVGPALSNVVIMRLPFAVPDQPLLAGRLERIRTQGGNPFMDYQLPAAIIKFKQGFGRLIRSRSDRGSVVVLDRRIVTRRYGRRFLEALGPCRWQVVQDDDETAVVSEPDG